MGLAGSSLENEDFLVDAPDFCEASTCLTGLPSRAENDDFRVDVPERLPSRLVVAAAVSLIDRFGRFFGK